MPRDGSGNYTYPSGTPGASGTPIESLKYNNYINDIAIDLNTPRPISSGGTGGTDQNSSLDNLSAEKFKQVVTNWDTTVWRAGSFYAASTAVGIAPVTGHAFAGICYFANATDFVCEATDLTDTSNPDKYIRVMAAGVWGAWIRLNASTSSANLGEYTFSNQVTFPPGSGEVRFNNITQASTTEVFISHLSPMGVDNSSQLTALLKSGVDILVQDKDEGSKYKIFTASADAVLSGSDFRTTVTFKSGGLDIVSAQRMLVAASGETQRVVQRQLIYAAPFDALAYNGMQINGSMEVSQQYGALTSVGWLNVVDWAVDGWKIYLKQATAGTTAFSVGSLVTPPGTPPFGRAFPACLQITATGAANFATATDYGVLYQFIEGYRFARVGWGSAAGQSVTVSFWIYASQTGTACMQLTSAGATTRQFIREFVVSAANTWQYVTLTFPPDTAGPANWLITNGVGVQMTFCFGAGSAVKSAVADTWTNWTTPQAATVNQTNFFSANGSSVYITGVVVLPGTEAPSAARSALIMRPYDQELLTCKRYWQKLGGDGFGDIYLSGYMTAGSGIVQTLLYPVEMRASPTTSIVGAWSTVNCSGILLAGSTAKSLALQANIMATGQVIARTIDATTFISLDARL